MKGEFVLRPDETDARENTKGWAGWEWTHGVGRIITTDDQTMQDH